MYSNLFFLLALICCCQSCKPSPSSETTENTPKDAINETVTSNNIFQDNFKEEIYEQVFPWVMDSTFYTNPQLLTEKLGEYYNQKNVPQTNIVAFERQRLYGMVDSVWFINCKSTLEGYGCAYPTMHTQYLFDNNGKLIHKNQAAIAQFIPIIQDTIPVYMSIDHDCNGEGQHHFYIYEHGKLIDIFNVLMNDTPKTFDANPDQGMFVNQHLALSIEDVNNDGHKDIVLKGKWLNSEQTDSNTPTKARPSKSELVSHQFIYKPTKEYFLLSN